MIFYTTRLMPDTGVLNGDANYPVVKIASNMRISRSSPAREIVIRSSILGLRAFFLWVKTNYNKLLFDIPWPLFLVSSSVLCYPLIMRCDQEKGR